MASLASETLDNLSQPPGDGGSAALPSPVQRDKPLPVPGSGPESEGGVGSRSEDFPLPSIPPPPPPLFSQTVPPNPAGIVYGLPGPPASSSSQRLVQTLPGSFPDIYDGDMTKWQEHFHSIQRAYKEFGKEDDFAIRVLTEDFTLPFPFAWPAEGEAPRPMAYDPADCSGFDFFLHPGRPVPRLLQPLHDTTQAFFKKRRLERRALNYASNAALVGTPRRLSQETSSPLQPDIMVITSMPCVATTTVPGEPSIFMQDGKPHQNIQPAPLVIPNSAPMQPINLQFMRPTNHCPF